MNCQCCGSKIDGQWCKICNYVQRTYTDRESLEQAIQENLVEKYKKTSDYRESILSHMTSISIASAMYRYNDGKKAYEKKGTVELFPDLTGEACSDKVIKSEQWIAHTNKMEVKIDYIFAGVTKSVTVIAFPKEEEGIWKLTLHLNEELGLEVGLAIEPVGDTGKKENHQALGTVDLELKAV